MSTCIFPGKFQPFHQGHLMVVQGMMKSCSSAVIAICHEAETGKNDIFTVEEVREMISAALLSADIVDATIVVIEDCHEDAEWVDKVLEAAGWPEEVQFWSGNEEVIKLLESLEKNIQKITHVPGHDSKEIRGWIKVKDASWRSKVPAGAMDVIDKKLSGGE
jgi:nicotinamide-nucleotide adenylyltransferase